MAEGGCRCGAVRFSTAGAPLSVAHCHCADCRAATSSPFTTWADWREEQVTFRGDPATWASSPGVVRGFCATCGSPLSYRSRAVPGEVHLLVCAFDQPEALTPTEHDFAGEQLPWIHLADRLPRFAGVGRV